METAMDNKVVGRFGKDKRAVTALEYGLIAAVILVVCATGFASVGNELSNMITTMMNCYTNASSC
jgi:Flp pilus assembly pilin Flp